MLKSILFYFKIYLDSYLFFAVSLCQQKGNKRRRLLPYIGKIMYFEFPLKKVKKKRLKSYPHYFVLKQNPFNFVSTKREKDVFPSNLCYTHITVPSYNT